MKRILLTMLALVVVITSANAQTRGGTLVLGGARNIFTLDSVQTLEMRRSVDVQVKQPGAARGPDDDIIPSLGRRIGNDSTVKLQLYVAAGWNVLPTLFDGIANDSTFEADIYVPGVRSGADVLHLTSARILAIGMPAVGKAGTCSITLTLEAARSSFSPSVSTLPSGRNGNTARCDLLQPTFTANKLKANSFDAFVAAARRETHGQPPVLGTDNVMFTVRSSDIAEWRRQFDSQSRSNSLGDLSIDIAPAAPSTNGSWKQNVRVTLQAKDFGIAAIRRPRMSVSASDWQVEVFAERWRVRIDSTAATTNSTTTSSATSSSATSSSAPSSSPLAADPGIGTFNLRISGEHAPTITPLSTWACLNPGQLIVGLVTESQIIGLTFTTEGRVSAASGLARGREKSYTLGEPGASETFSLILQPKDNDAPGPFNRILFATSTGGTLNVKRWSNNRIAGSLEAVLDGKWADEDKQGHDEVVTLTGSFDVPIGEKTCN